MQKVLRRNILSRNQLLRRARKEIKQEVKIENQKILTAKVRLNRFAQTDIKAERKNRREDWLLGPLAPNRDVGKLKDAYGSMDPERQTPAEIPVAKRAKYCNFAVGDRVCVIEGREKGKIGEVQEVDRKTETVTVQGLNVQNIHLPHYVREIHNDPRTFAPSPFPIPFSSVRLVTPLPKDPYDPSSPQAEAIVRSMYGGPPFKEQPYGVHLPAHTRYISGLNEPIPWPDAEAEDIPDEEVDTTRYLVEERTYLNDLTEMPMPEEAIDEIDKKRSRVKTRHNADWIKKMVDEDVYQSWQRRRKIMTPKEQMWEIKKRERKEELSELEVSEETMNLIRETQALNLGANKSNVLHKEK